MESAWLATLAPAGAHGIAGSTNFSPAEIYAKAVPR
jgi:hypothetical protein